MSGGQARLKPPPGIFFVASFFTVWAFSLFRLANQAFRQARQFRAGIRPPDHSPIWQHAENRPAHRTTQGLHAVTRFEISADGKLIHDAHKRFVIQHTGDEVGHGRNDFAQASMRQFGENGGGNLTANVGKRVAIEKQERSAPVTLAQES